MYCKWSYAHAVCWQRVLAYGCYVVIDVYAGFGEVGVVVAAEGLEMFGVGFRASVSSVEVLSEEDAHLWHHRASVLVLRCSQFDGSEEVLLSVCSQHSYR